MFNVMVHVDSLVGQGEKELMFGSNLCYENAKSFFWILLGECVRTSIAMKTEKYTGSYNVQSAAFLAHVHENPRYYIEQGWCGEAGRPI